MSLFALLVGIDAYPWPDGRLNGARNDALAAEAYLVGRVPAEELVVRRLLDEEATREAVIRGFREHLGKAGTGDTALFWFSGHGSQAPVPPELAHLEPSGKLQTILCVDSRQGSVPDLLDKELALLVGEVADRGAHVALVMDCCHSESSSRKPPGRPGHEYGIRRQEPLKSPPPLAVLLAELKSLIGPGGERADLFRTADHVSLAACGSHQSAFELPLVQGAFRGVFSNALLNQLERDPAASYRELLGNARCDVENLVPQQRPVLFPAGGTTADQAFLGGRVRVPPSSMTLRFRRGVWTIDAGACHGIAVGSGADSTVVAVHGSDPLLEARVVQVFADHSVVEPIDWPPGAVAREAGHPIVVSRVPLPAEAVVLDDVAEESVRASIAAAVGSAGSGGTASPHVRLAGADEPAGLRIETAEPGAVLVTAADGSPLSSPAPCRTPEEAALVVADLEHIAKWRLVRSLDNPLSRLVGAVRIEVAAVRPGESIDPRDSEPLRVDADGAVHLQYSRAANGAWVAPNVFVRLHNTSDRDLYCVLLDLTDRFRIHPNLFPGTWVRARYTASAAWGGPVELSLPPDRLIRPDAHGTDWLKVLVAEEAVNSAPFQLPRLGEPPASRRPVRSACSGIVERLGFSALYRDADARSTTACDWTTAVLPIAIRVPRGPRRE